MKTNTLAQKIGAGFAALLVILTAAVALTIIEVRALSEQARLLVELREPTSRAALELDAGINRSIAVLRGWILTQDQRFRDERAEVWRDRIRAVETRMVGLAQGWDAGTLVGFTELQGLLDRQEAYQIEVEALAPIDQAAAVQMLEDVGSPLNAQVRDLLATLLGAQTAALNAGFLEVTDSIAFLSRLEWMLLGAGIALGLLLSFLITRSVTRPVTGAVQVADGIAAGDLTMPVHVGGSYELDMLGRALTGMRDSLRQKTLMGERLTWLTAGQNRLNEAMRGDKSTDDMAAAVITFLANYVGAQAGSLYVVDDVDGELRLAALFALARHQLPARLGLGEGLVGQCALEARPMLLTAIEPEHLRISSGLLETLPRHVLVVPFLYQDRTLGVVELGKLDPFSDTEQQFLTDAMTGVGIAIASAISRQKVQMLLEETQQQSEELQQQQEELEQSNEELEEQAQKLKEQQEELQATNEELETQSQEILQKNKALEAARDSIEIKARQLEVSGKYKSEFLANMSHELRTPLNSLLILANDLAANGKGNLDEEQVESAEVISKSGHDLLHLINDILDLSKVEAGKLELNVSPIRLREFADNLHRNFRRLAQEKRLALKFVIDPLVPEVLRSDRNRVEQILNNLISNALKFTDEGEVRVSFDLDHSSQLAISVSDTGIGIPKDKLAAVFEAFVQVEGGTARRYGGTGLGLSISRELAHLLGGRVALRSELGQGSTFTLTLPLEIAAQPRAVPPPAPMPAPRPAGGAVISEFRHYASIPDQRDSIGPDDLAVLIIDDDDDFARILAKQARDKGFKHINASTGEDGIELARNFKPHAIILDLDLPGIDGHSVLRQLKSDPALRHIPVHIMSVNERHLEPIRSGAVDYLTKPVTKEQLNSAFERMESFVRRKMKNLLVVEDDANLRMAIRKLIGNGDVKTWEAGSAREALALFAEHTIDCMVLDVGLPDMTGFELIRKLEADRPQGLPPIIVYTGKELSRQENDELQQYAETIIVKGVKSEERLLDETALFLHRTVKDLPAPKQEMITRLYDPTGVLKGRKILVVDDDMRNVFALSKVLKERGMDVHKAENGRRALEMLEADPAMDFVLMDIMMPEMDGYECTRRIRAQGRFRDLPIVCLTAKAMKDDRQKCIDAGANDYISKPVDTERLISLMRIWIRK